jgi:hypothetical protein
MVFSLANTQSSTAPSYSGEQLASSPELSTPVEPLEQSTLQPIEHAPQVMHEFTNVLPTPETVAERVATPPLEPSLDPDLLKFDNLFNNYDPTFAESFLIRGVTSFPDADLTNTHFASDTQHIGTSNNLINDALFTSMAFGVNHTDTNHSINTDVNTFGNALLANANSGGHSTALNPGNLIHPAANVDRITTPGGDAFPTLTTTQSIAQSIIPNTNMLKPPVADTNPATVLQTNTENTIRRSGRAVIPTEKVAQSNKANKPIAEAGKENMAGSGPKGTAKRGGHGSAGVRPSKRARTKG